MEEERVAPEKNSQSDNQPEGESGSKESENSEKDADNNLQSPVSKEEVVANQQEIPDSQSDDSEASPDPNPATEDQETPQTQATEDQETPQTRATEDQETPQTRATEDQETPQTQATEETTAQNRPPEPCWYCLRSLDSQYRPQIPKQEETDSSSVVPSSGNQRVMYQTDPRPHFGVAWSSHAPGHPLWDSEGPCWGQRNQEIPNPTHTCPHCHLGLPADTLRWHEAKCLLFEELRAAKK